MIYYWALNSYIYFHYWGAHFLSKLMWNESAGQELKWDLWWFCSYVDQTRSINMNVCLVYCFISSKFHIKRSLPGFGSGSQMIRPSVNFGKHFYMRWQGSDITKWNDWQIGQCPDPFNTVWTRFACVCVCVGLIKMLTKRKTYISTVMQKRQIFGKILYLRIKKSGSKRLTDREWMWLFTFTQMTCRHLLPGETAGKYVMVCKDNSGKDQPTCNGSEQKQRTSWGKHTVFTYLIATFCL